MIFLLKILRNLGKSIFDLNVEFTELMAKVSQILLKKQILVGDHVYQNKPFL